MERIMKTQTFEILPVSPEEWAICRELALELAENNPVLGNAAKRFGQAVQLFFGVCSNHHSDY